MSDGYSAIRMVEFDRFFGPITTYVKHYRDAPRIGKRLAGSVRNSVAGAVACVPPSGEWRIGVVYRDGTREHVSGIPFGLLQREIFGVVVAELEKVRPDIFGASIVQARGIGFFQHN